MGTDRDSESAPESATEVTRREEVMFVVRRVARRFFRVAAPDTAAGLTFYALLAAVPALVAAFSIVRLIGEERDGARALLELAREAVAPDVFAAISEPVEKAAEVASTGWVLVASLVVALWSVARYVTALGRAINRIYGVPEGRMLWKAKPVHLLVTLAVFVLAAVAVAIAALSRPLAESIGHTLGIGETGLIIWRIARWPALAIVVILVIAMLYYFAPNIRHPHFRLVSVGAVIAVTFFAIASVAFGIYVSRIGDYDRIYGSFAGVIIFFLWLWIGNTALLLGVIFDAEFERVRELRAGIPAERELQVELRDTSRTERNAANDVADERAARRLRRSRR